MIDATASTAPTPEYAEALERIATAEAAPSKRGLSVRFDNEIETLPPVQWLADKIIPANALTAIYGAPGAGKSFVALDLALAVATGTSWMGRDTLQGSVLYLAAEGLAGLPQRIRAWKEAHGYAGRALGVGFVTVALDLLQPTTVTRVVDACAALHAPVRLVVVDTLARSMIGDENDTRDMSRLVANADAIRVGTNATVKLVHHTRKDSDLERGSSALRGAVDTLLLCRDGDDGRELVCEKQKDAEQFSPIPFRLTAGHGSCIVQATVGTDPGSAREQEGAMTPKRHAVLRTLCDAFTDRGATAGEWLRSSRVQERTFYSIRTWLVRNGYVSEKGQRYTATPSGRYAAGVPPTTASTAMELQNPMQSPVVPPFRGGTGLRPGNTATATALHDRTTEPPVDDDYYADLLSDVDERLGLRSP